MLSKKSGMFPVDTKQSEAGFTLIELLYTFTIIGVLSVLSMSAFFVYKENAEYAKAEATLHGARLALQQGELDASPGMNVGMTWTGTGGGVVSGDLAVIMPGASTSKKVRLGGMYNDCSALNGLDPWEVAIAQPCNADRYVRWTKFCNGIQLLETEVARDYTCN
jgi:prepilin-type N-terminal cleavage/methylation domain-containing protein